MDRAIRHSGNSQPQVNYTWELTPQCLQRYLNHSQVQIKRSKTDTVISVAHRGAVQHSCRYLHLLCHAVQTLYSVCLLKRTIPESLLNIYLSGEALQSLYCAYFLSRSASRSHSSAQIHNRSCGAVKSRSCTVCSHCCSDWISNIENRNFFCTYFQTGNLLCHTTPLRRV